MTIADSISLPASEWAPSSHIVIHNAEVRTSFSFSPMIIANRQDADYFCEVRVYGSDPLQPIARFAKTGVKLTDNWVLTSEQIAEKCGLDEMLHYIEFYGGSRDFQPPTISIVIPLSVHFRSITGSMEGHIPSGYIYGAGRYTRRARYYYENIPGVQLNDTFKPFILTTNPFVRDTKVSYLFYAGKQPVFESEWFNVRAKSVFQWQYDGGLIGDPNDVFCLVVRGEEKTSSFVGLRHFPSGQMASIDHMHPFFSR